MNLPPDERLRAEVGELLEDAGEASVPEVLEPILTHLRLLAAWNEAYGLTRITVWPEIKRRHVEESLLPLRWIGPLPGRLLDIGSGNGFPALPLLACRPQLAGVLLERSEKKCLFLDAVVRESAWSARVTIQAIDAERFAAAGMNQGAFDHVISRATLAPEAFLGVASRCARPGGRVFMYAGEAAARAGGAGSTRVGAGSASVGNARRLGGLARERIPGRRDSYLHVLEAPRNPAA